MFFEISLCTSTAHRDHLMQNYGNSYIITPTHQNCDTCYYYKSHILISVLEMHSIIVKEGHDKDSFVANGLVDMYAKHGLFEESLLIIVKLPTNDAIPWNALISGYIDHGLDQEALKCIEEMQIRDIPQDVATFIYGLKACGNLGFIERGLELHTWIS